MSEPLNDEELKCLNSMLPPQSPVGKNHPFAREMLNDMISISLDVELSR